MDLKRPLIPNDFKNSILDIIKIYPSSLFLLKNKEVNKYIFYICNWIITIC